MISKEKFLNEPAWGKALARYVNITRTRKGYTFKRLALELEQKLGVVQNDGNLRTKINRGNFGAQLFLMCLTVMDQDSIDIGEINSIVDDIKKEMSQ